MRRLLLSDQPTQVVLDVNDTFGCATDYHLFLVRSDLPPLAFAHQCSQWFQVDFSYIQDYAFDTTGDEVSVPVFSAVFRPQNNLLLAIIPNKVLAQLSNPQDNYTLSIPLFDDAYYFLGNSGFCRYPCPYDGYDYVFLITVDKESAIEDALTILYQHAELHTQVITNLLTPQEEPVAKDAKRKGKAKKVEKQPLYLFLRSCCLEIMRAHDAMENNRISRFLGQNRRLPEVNYVHRVKSIFDLMQQPNPFNTQQESLVMESLSNQKLITREDV